MEQLDKWLTEEFGKSLSSSSFNDWVISIGAKWWFAKCDTAPSGQVHLIFEV